MFEFGRGSGPLMRAALAAWRPPMPFSVLVRYHAPGRQPEALWTMPFLCDGSGRVVHYLAAGRAGVPVGAAGITRFDVRGLPEGASVQVVTDVDRAGRSVYGAPRHTMN